MALTDFDKYFMNFPPFDREDDFIPFWEKAASDIKKIPLELSAQKDKKKGGRFYFSSLIFRSFMKTQITGELLIPRDAEHPPVIIIVHDYNRRVEINEELLDSDIAYFFIMLRGHSIVNEPVDDAEKDEIGLGYLIENILDKETYYVKAVYLDVFRSIDALRLITKLDCSKIGIIGKGLGAAAGLFAAVNSQRVSALVLDTPSFCHLSLSQNKSQDDTAKEINDYISKAKTLKKKVKLNLSYFDALNFSDMVTCPVLATVGFKDIMSPPECVFSLFNHLNCEKTLEIYPDEGNTAGGDSQFRKSIMWIKDKIQQ
ncbi:MAG: acetylxylan esterase [Spirochaetia bacterium]|jgi:cephalosporin-C deacetylase-like acetyl esterase|nr:acetylxylan esterase [Spirochaetia bacterium]